MKSRRVVGGIFSPGDGTAARAGHGLLLFLDFGSVEASAGPVLLDLSGQAWPVKAEALPAEARDGDPLLLDEGALRQVTTADVATGFSMGLPTKEDIDALNAAPAPPPSPEKKPEAPQPWVALVQRAIDQIDMSRPYDARHTLVDLQDALEGALPTPEPSGPKAMISLYNDDTSGARFLHVWRRCADGSARQYEVAPPRGDNNGGCFVQDLGRDEVAVVSMGREWTEKDDEAWEASPHDRHMLVREIT